MNKNVLITFTCSVVIGCAITPQRDDIFTLDQRLIIAAYQLDIDEVVLLVADGANTNARFGKGNVSVFRDRWDHGAPAGARNWTPLLAAVNSPTHPDPEHEAPNSIAEMRQARKRRESIPPSVIRDREKRRLAIVELLIDAGADIDADDGYGATPLYEAVRRRYEDIAFAILRCNPNVNTTTRFYICPSGYYTPLHKALESPRLMRELISRGADLNAQEAWGNTPLMVALTTGNTNAAIILMEAGALLPKGGRAASSLFHKGVFLASEKNVGLAGAEATFRLLIQADADPNGVLDIFDGGTALHLAIIQIKESAPFVQMLLEHGADVNVQDDNGMTPLHFAAISLRRDVAQMLINAGADTLATNHEGQTPSQLAEWVLDEDETPEMDDFERQMLREERAIASFFRNAEDEQRRANQVLEDTARKLTDPQH